MNFVSPDWLWAIGPALLLLVALYAHGAYHVRERLHRFSNKQLLPQLLVADSALKRQLRRLLVAAGLVLTILALARPSWDYEWEERESRGIDVLIALDTSRSMLAEDIKPNRLQRSKLAILDLLETLRGDAARADRVGLIPFAGNAFLQCPLTLDYNAFELNLDAVDTDTIPYAGTDLSIAIDNAAAAFDKDANHKLLLLVTDGEDHEERGRKAAELAADFGIRIYTVGVGTAEGILLTERQENGQRSYVRDESGQPVLSRLDASTLYAIAEVTGGSYTPLGRRGEGLTKVYLEELAQLAPEEREGERYKLPIEHYQWPLGFAILLLCLEPLINTRKWARNGGKAAALLLLAGLSLPDHLEAQEQVLVSEDNAAQAEAPPEPPPTSAAIIAIEAQLEESPGQPELLYNLGTQHYREEAYGKAIQAFLDALDGRDFRLQNDIYYNLGNTYFRLAMGLPTEERDEAISGLEQAISAYTNAIELNPRDVDAEHNRDIAQQHLDRLLEEKKREEGQEQPEQDQSTEEEQPESEEGEASEDGEPGEQGEPQDGGQEGSENQGEGQQGQDGESDGQQSDGDASEDAESREGQQQPSEDGEAQEGAGEGEGEESQDEREGRSGDSGEEGEEEANGGGEGEEESGPQDESDEPRQAQVRQPNGEDQREGEGENEGEGEGEGPQALDGQQQQREGEDGENENDAEGGQQQARPAHLIHLMTPEESAQLLNSMRKLEKQLPLNQGLMKQQAPSRSSGKTW